MEHLLAALARLLIGLLQRLPLGLTARVGRAIGALVHLLDARHRRVARENLRRVFGAELTPPQIAALARENFRRIGENFACATRTAVMRDEEIREVLEVEGAEKVIRATEGRSEGIVVAIGHFGNFELYARARRWIPGFQFATTYRALRQPALNRVLQGLREQSGCLYFERRTESGALREAMSRQRLMIGFLADQHAGDRGLRVPFFGRDASTSAAPAVFALRYHCPLCTAVCFRVGPGRWRIELGDPIPTHANGQPREVEAIMRDVNAAFEAAIRRDPANWFWVHNRWKPGKYRSGPLEPVPAPPPTPPAADPAHPA